MPKGLVGQEKVTGIMDETSFPVEGIDPDLGPHAACALSDQEVEYLCGLLMWELSLRLAKKDYLELLAEAADGRMHLDEEIDQARRERDLLYFEREVLLDIQAIPVVGGFSEEPPTGMYL